MADPALVAVDWGTSSFRAFLMDGEGRVLSRRAAPAGIMQIEAGAFEATLERELAELGEAARDLPIIASGMITSRQGWVEVPYRTCPAGAESIAEGLLAHRLADGRTVRFVPGLLFEGEGRGDDDVPDVMRGEETEILGLDLGGVEGSGGRRSVVLPGTHSKWVAVEAGRIVRFATLMTGEVFATLRDHSILGRLMRGKTDGGAGDDDAFARGVGFGLLDRKGAGGLLKRLFSARTLPLTGRLAEEATADYLSGLLIGAEIREARDFLEADNEAGPITLAGGSDLVARYRRALAIAGIAAVPAPADAAARGLFRIARAAGVIA